MKTDEDIAARIGDTYIDHMEMCPGLQWKKILRLLDEHGYLVAEKKSGEVIGLSRIPDPEERKRKVLEEIDHVVKAIEKNFPVKAHVVGPLRDTAAKSSRKRNDVRTRAHQNYHKHKNA